MKTIVSAVMFLAVLLTASCTNMFVSSTETPVPTSTVSATQTALPSPTVTATQMPPTLTPTNSGEENVVTPRWMILGQPGYSVEFFGKTWNYSGDNWGEQFACIDYTLEAEEYMFFEQCFALSQETQNFETVLAPFLTDGFEALEPKTTFEGVEKISLVGKKEAEDKIHLFQILGSHGYILLVEMNFVTKDTADLQTLYESSAADIIDYALQDSLQKSHLVAAPAPTPLAQKQQEFYDAMSQFLITLPAANSIYSGTWDVLGDRVSNKRQQVCRDFEDRTNADVLWVAFSDCVFAVEDFPFEDIAQYYQNPGDVELTSSHRFDGKFVLYAYQEGHTHFDVYLQNGDYIFLVSLESRTMAGMKAQDVFSQDVDDFMHSILMANSGK